MKGSERLSKIFGEVADAIRTKKGTNELIKPEDFSAEISSIGAGSTDDTDSASKGVVTFYDYDGVVLHSYTKDKFLSLSAMPNLPEREGLICQGWNWSFADAVAYVQEYEALNVGAAYITDDGKTRLYIRIAAEGRMDVPLYFSQTVDNGVVIDWGDGSATQTVSGTGKMNTTHKYAELGDYVITLNPVEGCNLGLGNASSSYCVMGDTLGTGLVYCNMLQRVEIGRGVTSIGTYAFNRCYSLASVVIPNSVTSISYSAFSNCSSLASVVIPDGVTDIGSSAFSSCLSLASIVIPEGVTNIGNGAFSYCYPLASVIIPDGVTNIGDNAFSNCYSLASVIIPDGVTNIGYNAFSNCYSLASIVIPNNVTNIGSSAFSSCPSLASVVIPNSVTGIENYAFSNCYSMAFYDFSTHTAVPTLSGTNAFKSNSIVSEYKIIVPDALYDTWKSATNWSTYASRIIKKTDWDASQA